MIKDAKSKRTYHHKNLKDALIETSLLILEESGLESISLRKVTSRIGSSRTSVYRHFDSKEQLLQAVILKGFRKLDSTLKPILMDSNNDIPTRLKQMGKAYIYFALENKALYRLMLGEKLSKLRESTCTKETTPVNTGFDSLVSLLLEAQKAKIFLSGNVEIQASTIWAIIHGQASLFLDNHLMIERNQEEILNETLDVILRGYLL